MTTRTRSDTRTSWVAGLVLGALGGFLALEFPIFGLVLTVVSAALVVTAGRPLAGLSGVVTGWGGTWLALFGRVGLSCADGSCEAPGIVAPIAISAAILGVGVMVSLAVVIRGARRR